MNVSSPDKRWVVIPKPNPRAAMRLVCFPYAGGGPEICRDWPGRLPDWIEVCAIHLPGRGTRLSEPLFNRVEPLVAELTPALRPYLDKPFVFFGHSMGALVGFEITRALRRDKGPQPLHLIASGLNAPQIRREPPYTYELPDDEFVERIRELEGTPEGVLEHAELRELVMPLLRAEFELSEMYACKTEAPLDCPITAYGGLADRDVPKAHVEAWREQTNAAFSFRMFQGGHLFIHTAQSLLLSMLLQDIYGTAKGAGLVR